MENLFEMAFFGDKKEEVPASEDAFYRGKGKRKKEDRKRPALNDVLLSSSASLNNLTSLLRLANPPIYALYPSTFSTPL